MIHEMKRAALGAAFGAAVVSLVAGSALAADPSWLDKDLLAKAKKEGSVVVYASMNEKEGAAVYKVFEKATGIKVEYVRSSDTGLMARIIVEKRAGKDGWDILQTTALHRLPKEWLSQLSLPMAKNLPAIAKDSDNRWFGIYANYNGPAYNTKLVKESDLPKTYDELVKKKEWAGKIAIDGTDEEWLYALCKHYGEEKGLAHRQEHRQEPQAGHHQGPPRHGALGRRGRVSGRAQQLHQPDREREDARRPDRLLDTGAGHGVLRPGGRELQGAAPERRAAGRQLPDEP